MFIDLHCDLLSYLQLDHKRTPFDPLPRCSYPQLLEGKVMAQTLAISSITYPKSSADGAAQAALFLSLLEKHPEHFSRFSGKPKLKQIQIIPSIENASCLCNETETLNSGLKRLKTWQQTLGPIFYISLTWNGENRFGGGAGSSQGLKADGKALLEEMEQLGIAVDFSHTSDALASDILNYIDAQNLKLSVMASHSNFRPIHSAIRNLPETIAKEIIRRQGIIGMVLYKKFVNPADPAFLARHVSYGIKLGAEHALSFGADFFCFDDFIDHFPDQLTDDAGFFDEYPNASCYPNVLRFLEKNAKLSAEQLQQIAYKNALHFLIKLFKTAPLPIP